MRNLEKRKSDKAEEVQTEADFVKEQAMQQYEKYRRVEPSERGTAMFDEMLRLKRENMILEDENKTLKKKLQKAYDFMKRFTINGLNMLESFFAIYWGKKCVSFQRILVLTVEVDNYNRKGKMNIDNDKRLIFI